MNVLGILTILAGTVLGADNPSIEFLSDVLDERIYYHTQGWGELGIDTAVRPTDGRAPTPLRILETTYAKGLGHHAPGEIVADLGGQYAAFEAEVGVQWQDAGTGSVVFQVFVDGEKQFDSGVMTGRDAAQPVRVPVAGAGVLRLAVTDAGDGILFDCADWANAKLIKAESAPVAAAAEPFDVAPFAYVVTSDPHRNDGARSTRVQEFQQDDIYLDTPVTREDASSGHEAGGEGSQMLGAASVPWGELVVPTVKDGAGCIGLRWAETRMLRSLGLAFAEDAETPATDGVQVQYWAGESPWQGQWQPFKGDIAVEGKHWSFTIAMKTNPDFPRTGVDKIRWVFPHAAGPIRLKTLSAYSRSHTGTISLRLEQEIAATGKQGHVDIYNGAFVAADGTRSLASSWDLAAPLRLNVQYTKPMPWKTDRTILQVLLPGGVCGVAIEDVLAKGAIFVRGIGLYVTADTNATTAGQYLDSIKDRKTVLQRVREMPDQTLAQALEKTHNPIQNNGPMMLSLACDNRKWIVHRDGAIQFNPSGHNAEQKDGMTCPTHRLTAQFGASSEPRTLVSGKPEDNNHKGDPAERRLGGTLRLDPPVTVRDWLPAPVATWREKDVVYKECVIVTTPDKAEVRRLRPLGAALFLIENTGEAQADVCVRLGVADEKKPCPPTISSDGAFFAYNGDLIASVMPRASGSVACKVCENEIVLSGALAPHASAAFWAYMPGWKCLANGFKPTRNAAELFSGFEDHWARMLADTANIEVPDPLLANIIKASRIHCMLAARDEQDGRNIAAWAAADRYGALESESHSVILGMDLMGHSEFARRSLDYFVKRYNGTRGYLTTGYTLMGTGWHLWTLARHYDLTEDKPWLTEIAPRVAQACFWIAQQCEMTKKSGADLEVRPEYGLVPPGVGADWNRFAYRFAVQAHYYAGLNDTARALMAIKHPRAPRLTEIAEDFRQNILRAFQWNQEKSPALELSNGTFIPADGGMLYGFGATGDIIPGEDGNRSWCYDVELGAHHMIPLGVLDPQGPVAADMMDRMEDYWFLHSGMGEYPEDKNHEDWFNLGGFSKVQPYYTRNAEICALRDDVKPFIRSYFNALASLINLENLSFWEHFHNQGAWNKTHETGWFLVQTRTMMLMERGDELWLAPFVTNRWMEDGMIVAVTNAPTVFGPVSFRIRSIVNQGYIEASVQPPARRTPAKIAIRLRHPQGLPMQSVTVNGKPHNTFDAKKEYVLIDAPSGPLTIRAEYGEAAKKN